MSISLVTPLLQAEIADYLWVGCRPVALKRILTTMAAKTAKG